MTQVQWMLLLLRIALVADAVTIFAFGVDYTRLARWYKDPIGRTIMIQEILLLIIMVPTALSLFFQFSRLNSDVSAWIDIAAFGLLAPVMAWRIVVFERIHRRRER